MGAVKQQLNDEVFSKTVSRKSLRDAVGDALVEVASTNEKVVCLTADLKESCRLAEFERNFPDRFIECGVSEQAMVTVASGIASLGFRPFTCSFSVFSPGRTWEQIRTTICLNDQPVVICGFFVGVSVGQDGATHQMLEDIALTTVLPNLTCVAPCDFEETKKAVKLLSTLDKPSYLRIPRVESPEVTKSDSFFELGKALCLWEDKNPEVAIVAHGTMVYKSLVAAKKLSALGIGSLVYNFSTLKPLDSLSLVSLAKQTGCVVVCEEHQKRGGLFSIVCENLSSSYPVPVEFVGIEDQFGQSGDPVELMKHYGLTSENIVLKSKLAIKRKKQMQY